MQASNQNKLNFLVEEYRMLRTEIESYSKQKRQLEISVISAILVIYGFVASSGIGKNLKTLILLAPIVIVLWGAYRFAFYDRVIRKEVRYVKERIEPVFFGADGGWEVFWEKAGTWGLLTRTEKWFWIIAGIATVVVFIFWPILGIP